MTGIAPSNSARPIFQAFFVFSDRDTFHSFPFFPGLRMDRIAQETGARHRHLECFPRQGCVMHSPAEYTPCKSTGQANYYNNYLFYYKFYVDSLAA